MSETYSLTRSGVSIKKPGLLVIGGQTVPCNKMEGVLEDEYEVFLAENRVDAIDLFRKKLPSTVTLDLGPTANGRKPTESFRTLSELLQIKPDVKIVVIGEDSSSASVRRVIEQGAFDYFSKPVAFDEVRVTLRRAIHLCHMEEEIKEIERRPFDDEEMLGTHQTMGDLRATIRKVAKTDIPVLITGETGTGKELVARAIHRESLRDSGPFVAINCGAIPENLLESELFGHEKGSFTGAHAKRRGQIEYASGGTLFLDEIGELSLGLQVKLLRFLQESKIIRVGGRESILVNVRIVAATNRDPTKTGANGGVRPDLFYRLSGVSIAVPPLRKREGDILLLARAFIRRFSNQFGKRVTGLNRDAKSAIARYHWPGNVRELENKIRGAVLMAEQDLLTPDDIDLTGLSERAFLPNLKTAREALEKELVGAALARFEGNVTQAADAIGVSRQRFRELIMRHGIDREA